jgi:ribosomal RNA-processing protein 12
MSKYAKNYLPLLFNLYTTEKWNLSRDPVRQSVFETIKRYLTMTDSALSQSFFDKCLEKIQNSDTDQNTLYEEFPRVDYCSTRHCVSICL